MSVAYGGGESEDCLAVIDYARAQHPQVNKLAIAGFSFGGYVSLFAAAQCSPDLLLLMAPAVGMYQQRDTEPNAPDATKTLLIHGETDEVVPVNNAFNWAAEQDIPVVVLPRASHFFHGKLIPLRNTILQFVPAILNTEN